MKPDRERMDSGIGSLSQSTNEKLILTEEPPFKRIRIGKKRSFFITG